MKYTILVVSVFPFLIDIAVKLVSNFVDPQLMRKALTSLVTLPMREGEKCLLNGDQREVIVAHLSHESLKAVTVLTTISSFFVAVLVLWNAREKWWPLPLLFAVFLFGIILVGWTYTKDVAYMNDKNCVGLRRDTSVVLLLCFYDVILGFLTVIAG
jgi:hypothetical protein